MSLLNDALRDLEKRENEPGGAEKAIPAGLAQTTSGPGWFWPATGVALAVLFAMAGGTWFWLEPGNDTAASAPDAPALQPAPQPVIRPDPRPAADNEPRFEPEPLVRAVEPVPEPQPVAQAEPDAAPDPAPEPEPEPEGSVAAGGNAEPESPPEQASVRELTPRERDRRLASRLEDLLDSGQAGQARERLSAHLVLDSDAPRSREVMALYHLRRGNPGRAREWLPDTAVRLYPSLRLLRARVARSEQGRGEALAWLEQDPPAAERYPDYHTMLAALYQQTGQPGEAASIWAGLLETDDSQARWWAGLGIALESQGRSESARSAFAQAARLPGLPEQLRLYVEQRLSGEQG